jgi:nitrate reductase NapE component
MFGFDADKSWWSLGFAVIMLSAGLLPLLTQFGVIALNIGFLTTGFGSFARYILAGGAIFLIIDSFMETLDEPIARISIILGFLFLAIGILPVLGVTIPFIYTFLTPMVYNILFIIEGILLLLGSFQM